eukprot:13244963-Heterocapsa_arctica.AAC.1
MMHSHADLSHSTSWNIKLGQKSRNLHRAHGMTHMEELHTMENITGHENGIDCGGRHSLRNWMNLVHSQRFINLIMRGTNQELKDQRQETQDDKIGEYQWFHKYRPKCIHTQG